MAKGNDGNYLQHCIEVEVAKHLAKTDPDGRLHVALTHGMAPFETLDKKRGSVEQSLLCDALNATARECQDEEPQIVKVYRKSGASPKQYPNTAELLRQVIGQKNLSGGITEKCPAKWEKLSRVWSKTKIRVANSSWREQLATGGVLTCPAGLNSPWLFSMDPMSYKENGTEDDGYLYHSDSCLLKPFLQKYFDNGKLGVACFFVYNLNKDQQCKFRSFINEIAENVEVAKVFYGVPHTHNLKKFNIAGLLYNDQRGELPSFSSEIQILEDKKKPGNSNPHILKLIRDSGKKSNNNPKITSKKLRSFRMNSCSHQIETDKDLERRITRMNIWLEHAESISDGENSEHISFLYYWIAYESAYQQFDPDGKKRKYKSEENKREKFHEIIAGCDHGLDELKGALKECEPQAVKLLELRQANPCFWRHNGEPWSKSLKKWEDYFKLKSEFATNILKKENKDREDIREALNSLFNNLSIVRNQVVHGGSSGEKSYGVHQVAWGNRILKSIIPALRGCIENNKTASWGKPPFPRVGENPDDKCPPPWFTGES